MFLNKSTKASWSFVDVPYCTTAFELHTRNPVPSRKAYQEKRVLKLCKHKNRRFTSHNAEFYRSGGDRARECTKCCSIRALNVTLYHRNGFCYLKFCLKTCLRLRILGLPLSVLYVCRCLCAGSFALFAAAHKPQQKLAFQTQLEFVQKNSSGTQLSTPWTLPLITTRKQTMLHPKGNLLCIWISGQAEKFWRDRK